MFGSDSCLLVVDKFQKDLGSILTFLKICQPLDNEDFYKRLLLRPLKNGEVSGAELLRVIINSRQYFDFKLMDCIIGTHESHMHQADQRSMLLREYSCIYAHYLSDARQ